MQPLAAFPHQLYVGRIPQMTFIACGVAHAQVLDLQHRVPFLVKYALLPDDVEPGCQPVTDGADNLSVLYRTRRVYQHTAEHLHVYAAVEHFNQSIVRQSRIWLEEHQRYLAIGREHRSVSPGMLLGKMRRKFIRHLLERKQGADASELADGKALAIFFQKIVFCKR